MTQQAGLVATLRQLGPAAVLAVFWAVCPALLGILLLVKIATVATWLEGPGIAGYALIFAVTCGLGVLPTYAQAVVGGWVFGAVAGTIGALVGFAGGALIGWGVTRVIAADRVARVVDRHPHGEVIRTALVGRGFWRTTGIVAMLRLPPNSPFALTNLVMASSGVPIGPYLLGTAAGMLPRTAVFVTAAAMASQGGEDLEQFISDGPGTVILVIGLVLVIAVLLILAQIGKRAVARLGKA